MNVIVIEDEKPAARRLKRMLQKLDIDVQVMLHSVEESLNWFQTNEEPDLIFLDIQLSDGLSFEIFEELPIHSAIIFTTAYDEYALKAFKLNSIDYLLKPIDEDELKNAVDKYHKQLPKSSNLKVNMDDIRKLLINPIDRKKCTIIYLDIPLEIRRKRLEERGDLNDKIERRIKADEKDFEGFTDYDIIVNNPNF